MNIHLQNHDSMSMSKQCKYKHKRKWKCSIYEKFYKHGNEITKMYIYMYGHFKPYSSLYRRRERAKSIKVNRLELK